MPIDSEYTIKLAISLDEFTMLKESMRDYIQSKKVTSDNFDTARDLYGKLEFSWKQRVAL